MVSDLQKSGLHTTQEVEVIKLSDRAQKIFAEALLNPPPPNAKLLEAVKRSQLLPAKAGRLDNACKAD